jgi:hypothetical protein
MERSIPLVEAGPESRFYAELRGKSPKPRVKLVTQLAFALCTGILEPRFSSMANIVGLFGRAARSVAEKSAFSKGIVWMHVES